MPIHWVWSSILALLVMLPILLQAPTENRFWADIIVLPGPLLKILGLLVICANGILLYRCFVVYEIIPAPSMLPFLTVVFFSALYFPGLGPDRGLWLQTLSILLLQSGIRLYESSDARKLAFDSGILVFGMWLLYPPAVLFGIVFLVSMSINKSLSLRYFAILVMGFLIPFGMAFWLSWYLDIPKIIPHWHIDAPHFEFITRSLRDTILSIALVFFLFLGLIGFIRNLENKAIREKTRLQTVGVFLFGWFILGWFGILSPDESQPLRYFTPALATMMTITMFNSRRKWVVDIILLVSLTAFCMVSYLGIAQ